ncbi:MAG TPA: thioesterase [Polyangiaceae bacterium]|nr:thioesterase [Polyangiaceae bacterium]
MTEVSTHTAISPTLVGEAGELTPGRATAQLLTTEQMAADAQGLVHGGFVFGLVDYAAMLAVNDPFVVLGSADVRFVAPVRVGEMIDADARVLETVRGKRVVEVSARVGERLVVRGTLVAFVLEEHVLQNLPHSDDPEQP